MPGGRKRLDEWLIERNIISQGQLDQALSLQQTSGARLDSVLVSLGFLTEDKLIKALEYQWGMPSIDLAGVLLDRETALLIPAALAGRHKVIAVERHGDKLTLAMADPADYIAIDDIGTITGLTVEPVIASERQIIKLLHQIYGLTDLVEKAVNNVRPDEAAPSGTLQTADDAPIIAIVNSLLSQAVQERASDIHIEPQEHMLRVRFRIDGILREVTVFPLDIHAAIVSRIKIMANMDIAEKRIPQDGHIRIQEAKRNIDIRISTFPTILGEKVVMRILDKSTVFLALDKLGFSVLNAERYKKLFSQPYGMILVTGPTGSGKTTTLYSTLAAVNTPEKNVITIEDPVEYRLEGINQTQINSKSGLTFANSLRSVLRQDPNIIMLGEIRDGETADIAIHAALTGHLVLSTLHTNDAASAILRLLDMGLEPFLIASSVLGVVAQRLVRCICPACKTAYALEDDSACLFLNQPPKQALSLYRGTGCEQCNGTGYLGRMAIHEVMPINPAIRELIGRRTAVDAIAAAAVQAGMVTLRDDGIQKALCGQTTIEEVLQATHTGM